MVFRYHVDFNLRFLKLMKYLRIWGYHVTRVVGSSRDVEIDSKERFKDLLVDLLESQTDFVIHGPVVLDN